MNLINNLPEALTNSIFNSYLSITDKYILNKDNYNIYLTIRNINVKKIQKAYFNYKNKLYINFIYFLNVRYIKQYYILHYPQELKIKYIRLAANKLNLYDIKFLYSQLIYTIEYSNFTNINIIINKYFNKCINELTKNEIEYIGW
jgi:hypothetical protein